MQKVMTIEEFQAMMAQEESGLRTLFRRIAQEASPWQLQQVEPQEEPDPLTTWVGWR